jgi:hypothetical protein
MRSFSSRLALFVGLSALAALVVAAPAGAVAVSGHQIPITGSKFKMKGDLLGKWKVTKFKVLDEGPVFRGKGKEKFVGCIDANRDHACEGEVTGKLYFKFRYWARFGDEGQVELGTCAHRVIGGTDGFAGASGFLQMVDTPIGKPPGFKTYYEGEINYGLNSGGAAAEVPGSC